MILIHLSPLFLSLFLSQSNKAVCGRSPQLPIEREISLWTSKRLQLGYHKTLQSVRAVSGLRHLTSLPPLSLWLCQQLLLLLALSHSPYNDISEIKMDYGASLTQSLQDVKPHVMLLLL